MKKIIKTAIIGMGALGVMYGDTITRTLGRDAVTFILDDERYEKRKNDSFTVNGRPVSFNIARASEAGVFDLLIVAVKYNGLSAALETAAPCVGEDTVIVSLLNGISSEEIISEHFGKDHVIHAVAQGMDATYFDCTLRYSSHGTLFIGAVDEALKDKLEAVSEFFERAAVPYKVEDDIMRRMWNKLMLNVGINQTCMVFDCGYGGAVVPGSLEYMTFVSAMRETMLCANAEGIDLSEDDLNIFIGLIQGLAPDTMPSMRQDRLNRRPSEVELFAGTVIRTAKRHGIAVPVNDYLYRRVKEIEAEYR